MSIGSIIDARIRVQPSQQLLEILHQHQEFIPSMPENVILALKQNGYGTHSTVEILSNTDLNSTFQMLAYPQINLELMNRLLNDVPYEETTIDSEDVSAPEAVNNESTDEKDEENTSDDKVTYFYLNDLKWLNQTLSELRKEKGLDVYLHKILETCTIKLPENEIVERNPELEARCQRLREEQLNWQYMRMTKNVDSALKHYPEDTIAYQMKAINKQIIAVLQFIFSVIAGFVFGFLGVELIIGNLDFGFRLLLGIMCALIIALAEIYFLAKKLNEFDDLSSSKSYNNSPIKNSKLHRD